MEEKEIQEEQELNEEISTEEENVETTEEKGQFNGYFHERDRLAENNIVNEVET